VDYVQFQIDKHQWPEQIQSLSQDFGIRNIQKHPEYQTQRLFEKGYLRYSLRPRDRKNAKV
jgi:hypothetical protein